MDFTGGLLLNRLSTLCEMTPQEVLEDNRRSRVLRCHPIDWSSKNIPISRDGLTWLPKEVLDNEDDFPILQFSISTGTGRFVGFFDREFVFNIVLLDPNHNIQPSNKTDYQIQPTTIGISQYDELLNKLENIKRIICDCSDGSCKLHARLDEIEGLHDNIIYTGLDRDYYTEYQDLIKKYTIREIFETGALQLMD